MPVDAKSAQHNDGSRRKNSLDKAAGENSGVPSAWWPVHDCRINRLYPQRLSWRAVHKYVLKVTLAARSITSKIKHKTHLSTISALHLEDY